MTQFQTDRAVAPLRPGYSKRVNSPAFQAMLRKNQRAALLFAGVLILAPLLIGGGIGWANDSQETLFIGIGVSGVFFIVNLISYLKKPRRTWDGVVASQSKEETRRRDKRNDEWVTETFCVTRIRRTGGKLHTLREREAHAPFYEYLKTGAGCGFIPLATGITKNTTRPRTTSSCAPCATRCHPFSRTAVPNVARPY